VLRIVTTLLFGAALAVGSPAPADPAAAEALFQQGRALLERGELASACAKFESSQANEPSGGTLLNLADCRARQGKTATAWAHFVAAERLSGLQGRPEQAAEARRRGSEIESTLSTLTLHAAGAPPALEVRVNGRKLDPGSMDSRLPMDPGVLSIEFSAPEYATERVVVTLRGAAHHLVVEAPRLTRQSSAPSPAKAEPAPLVAVPSAAPQQGSRTLAWVTGGFGAAALAVGGTFGVMALLSDAEAKKACDQRTTGCPSDAISAEEDRDRQALISTIGITTGLVGLGVSGVLLLTSPSPADQSVREVGLGLRLAPGKAFISGAARF
jgi:hypothetical protein